MSTDLSDKSEKYYPKISSIVIVIMGLWIELCTGFTVIIY